MTDHLSPPDDRTPTLLHDMNPPSPWQPERDPLSLAVLGKLSEELGEASAIVARCIIQGVGEVEPVTGKFNRAALMEEIADVQAASLLAVQHFDIAQELIWKRVERKVAHLKAWHAMLKEPKL